MNNYLKPVLLVIFYFVFQAVSGVVLLFILLIVDPQFRELAKEVSETGDQSNLISQLPISAVAIVSIVSSALAILVGMAMGLINLRRSVKWHGNGGAPVWHVLLFGIAGMSASGILCEELGLVDNFQDAFKGLMHNPWGLLYVCVLGPIMEELCLREGVCGGLLRKGVGPWAAILTSSLLFGIMHANPVQIVGAALMGVVLGIIYYKTGNVLLTSALHIFNNSLSSIMAVTLGMDSTMASMTGGHIIPILLVVVCGSYCIYSLVEYWKKGDAPVWTEEGLSTIASCEQSSEVNN